MTFTDSRRAPPSRVGRSRSFALPLIRFDVLATTRRPARATAVALQAPHVTPIRNTRPIERGTTTPPPGSAGPQSGSRRKLGIGSRTQLAAALG